MAKCVLLGDGGQTGGDHIAVVSGDALHVPPQLLRTGSSRSWTLLGSGAPKFGLDSPLIDTNITIETAGGKSGASPDRFVGWTMRWRSVILGLIAILFVLFFLFQTFLLPKLPQTFHFDDPNASCPITNVVVNSDSPPYLISILKNPDYAADTVSEVSGGSTIQVQGWTSDVGAPWLRLASGKGYFQLVPPSPGIDQKSSVPAQAYKPACRGTTSWPW